MYNRINKARSRHPAGTAGGKGGQFAPGTDGSRLQGARGDGMSGSGYDGTSLVSVDQQGREFARTTLSAKPTPKEIKRVMELRSVHLGGLTDALAVRGRLSNPPKHWGTSKVARLRVAAAKEKAAARHAMQAKTAPEAIKRIQAWESAQSALGREAYMLGR